MWSITVGSVGSVEWPLKLTLQLLETFTGLFSQNFSCVESSSTLCRQISSSSSPPFSAFLSPSPPLLSFSVVVGPSFPPSPLHPSLLQTYPFPPFLSLPSLLLPLPPLRNRPLNYSQGSGERCKLPSGFWGRGRSHGRSRFWCILALKSDILRRHFC